MLHIIKKQKRGKIQNKYDRKYKTYAFPGSMKGHRVVETTNWALPRMHWMTKCENVTQPWQQLNKGTRVPLQSVLPNRIIISIFF